MNDERTKDMLRAKIVSITADNHEWDAIRADLVETRAYGERMRKSAKAISDERDAYRAELESTLERSDRMSGADVSDYIALKRERDVLADRVDVSQSEFSRMVGLKNDMVAARDCLTDDLDMAHDDLDTARDEMLTLIGECKTYKDAAVMFERQRDQARQARDINKSYAAECRSLRGEVQDQRGRFFKLIDMLKMVEIDVIMQKGEPVAISVIKSNVEMDGDNDGDE